VLASLEFCLFLLGSRAFYFKPLVLRGTYIERYQIKFRLPLGMGKAPSNWAFSFGYQTMTFN